MAEVARDFNESALVRSLSGLSRAAQIAFATKTAERAIKVCCHGSRKTLYDSVLRPAADVLWESVLAERVQLESTLDVIINALPNEGDQDWAIQDALDDHAISSLAYAVRASLNQAAAQEAAWAARRAYELVDQAVLARSSRVDEEDIKNHPLVQRELARQQRDIRLLEARVEVGAFRAEGAGDIVLSAAEMSHLHFLT